MNLGDPIVVSDELGHFALANGFITEIRPDVLSVNVDRRLHGSRTRLPDFDAYDNQCFAGIAEILESGEARISSQLGSKVGTNLTYRVDKDEFKSGMAMARNNIIQLFTKEGDQKRRELIVRGRDPVFRHASQRTQYSYFEKRRDLLNVDQRKAVEKVLTGTYIQCIPIDSSGGLCVGIGNAWNRKNDDDCAYYSCFGREREECALDIVHSQCR